MHADPPSLARGRRLSAALVLGGTVLLTLFSVSGVQEIDATGKEVWRFDGR